VSHPIIKAAISGDSKIIPCRQNADCAGWTQDGSLRVLSFPILHLWSEKFQSFVFCDASQLLNAERKTSSQHSMMMFDGVRDELPVMQEIK
jgi:hypothetical protein